MSTRSYFLLSSFVLLTGALSSNSLAMLGYEDETLKALSSKLIPHTDYLDEEWVLDKNLAIVLTWPEGPKNSWLMTTARNSQLKGRVGGRHRIEAARALPEGEMRDQAYSAITMDKTADRYYRLNAFRALPEGHFLCQESPLTTERLQALSDSRPFHGAFIKAIEKLSKKDEVLNFKHPFVVALRWVSLWPEEHKNTWLFSAATDEAFDERLLAARAITSEEMRLQAYGSIAMNAKREYVRFEAALALPEGDLRHQTLETLARGHDFNPLMAALELPVNYPARNEILRTIGNLEAIIAIAPLSEEDETFRNEKLSAIALNPSWRGDRITAAHALTNKEMQLQAYRTIAQGGGDLSDTSDLEAATCLPKGDPARRKILGHD